MQNTTIQSEALVDTVFDSPDERLQLRFSVSPDGRLLWSLRRDTLSIVEPSALGVVLDGADLGVDVEIGDSSTGVIDESYPWRGGHSTAINQCTAAMTAFTHRGTGTEYRIESRIYNDGVAFRYLFSKAEGSNGSLRRVNGEATSWRFAEGTHAWYHTNTLNYEGIHERCEVGLLEPGQIFGPPVVLELAGANGFAAITEGGLFNYSGLVIQTAGDRRLTAHFDDDPAGWDMPGTFETPWRITLVAPDLNGLVNSDIVHNVCPPPGKELVDAPWIQAGTVLWSWWSWFNGVPPYYLPYNRERETRYIDRAAEFGIEFVLFDAGWENWTRDDADKWAVLTELVDYARSRGVGIWVWRDHADLLDPLERSEFLRQIQHCGVVGLKVDFMDSESKRMIGFYTAMLEETAQRCIMINFHGANKPTGESRTWPHEMTREGIYGLEHNIGAAIPPRHNVLLPFTRMLAGHGDYTPCTLTPERLRGTTFAHQMALTVALLSPLLHLPDHPDVYAREGVGRFLGELPTCWDETWVTPESTLGRVASIARRSGRIWYLAVLCGEEAEQLKISTAFLGDGNYNAEIYRDSPDDLQRFERVELQVNSSAPLPAALHPGGGLLARFAPI